MSQCAFPAIFESFTDSRSMLVRWNIAQGYDYLSNFIHIICRRVLEQDEAGLT